MADTQSNEASVAKTDDAPPATESPGDGASDGARPDHAEPDDVGAPDRRAVASSPEVSQARRDDRLRRAALWTWTLIGVVALLVGAWEAFLRLEVVAAPLLLALFPTAALTPAVAWLSRHRWPRPLAALVVVLAGVAVVGGIGLLVVPALLDQLPALVDSLTRSGTQLDALLNQLPGVRPNATVGDVLRRGALGLSGGINAALSAAASIITGALLVAVLWVFYLGVGPRPVRAGVRLLPARRRADARELLDRLWETLGSYVRALTAVALFDATAVGVGLWLLGVPLVLPLAVLVFVGAYFPYVGAFVSGLFAVLVALAENGLGTAVAVLALILVVQQIDGNVVQPLVMGRVVHVSGLTVVVAVTLGATLLGVLGAFLAVPVAAAFSRTLAFVRERRGDDAEADEPDPRTGDSSA